MDRNTKDTNKKPISVTTTSKVVSDRSEISIKEFLDFLKTAYQVVNFHYFVCLRKLLIFIPGSR